MELASGSAESKMLRVPCAVLVLVCYRKGVAKVIFSSIFSLVLATYWYSTTLAVVAILRVWQISLLTLLLDRAWQLWLLEMKVLQCWLTSQRSMHRISVNFSWFSGRTLSLWCVNRWPTNSLHILHEEVTLTSCPLFIRCTNTQDTISNNYCSNYPLSWRS